MLPKTEEILTKFRELNREPFYDSTKDFKPYRDLDGQETTSYGSFDEAVLIYQLMYSLTLQLDAQIFYGYYNKAYSNPLEPITLIDELYSYINEILVDLRKINSKYNDRNLPALVTLKNYEKMAKMLSYVLTLDEVKRELGDPEKEALMSELSGLKVKILFRKKQRRIILLFLFYSVCLVLPLIIIAISWNSHYQGKWFQLILYIFPFIGFLYDKKSFIQMIMYVYSKEYRNTLKKEWKNELE